MYIVQKKLNWAWRLILQDLNDLSEKIKENINFKHFASALLAELPSNVHEAYSLGYSYFINELFNSLDDGGIFVFQIDIGVYDLDLNIVIESILMFLHIETKKLKTSQISHYFEGVQVAIQSSTCVLELASLDSENNQAA